jgi:hypothetical protein
LGGPGWAAAQDAMVFKLEVFHVEFVV